MYTLSMAELCSARKVYPYNNYIATHLSLSFQLRDITLLRSWEQV